MNEQKQKILIVDDSEMNRFILTEMLEDRYDILEANNGVEALGVLKENAPDISIMLLDITMPKMNGFQVLTYMNEQGWNDHIAVIMISAEDSPSYMEHAYELGAFDYISRPFDKITVKRRIANTILIHAKQRSLEANLAERISRHERDNKLMISILSHIMEFRNGESGIHILNVNLITKMLLQQLMKKTDQYGLTWEDIDLISTVSSLHDIGKVSIPDEILNKPARLTPEEFEIMKSHTTSGSNMLMDLPFHQETNPLLKLSYEVCRWHHERFDGNGYPDGLKGDEIPIAAQIVGLADVYDALTSERCYKRAYSHSEAIYMIADGQCGVFNPLLLECFLEIGDALKETLEKAHEKNDSSENSGDILSINPGIPAKERSRRMLFDQQACKFLADESSNIIFFYTFNPSILTLNTTGMCEFQMPGYIISPENNTKLLSHFNNDEFENWQKRILEVTPESTPIDIPIHVNGELYNLIAKAIWDPSDNEKPMGFAGKLTKIPLSQNENHKTEAPAYDHR